MFSEDTNLVIKAIKKYNLKINDSFLRDFDQFRLAFEEDSVDEYLGKKLPFNPQMERLIHNARQHVEIINNNQENRERVRRNKSQNINEIDRQPKNLMDLLNLINPYKNPTIKGFQHAMHEFKKIEKFIYEEKLNQNTEIPNREVEEKANESLMDTGVNNKIRAPEENVENTELTMNKNEAEKNFIKKIEESFCKNLDFSLLVSEKLDNEEIELLDLIKDLLFTNKDQLNFESFYEKLKRESTKMLEYMDKNKTKIIKLVKRGYLFNLPSKQIKLNELKESALRNDISSKDNLEKDNKKFGTEKKNILKFLCTFEDCGRMYSSNSALKVHIKKHHFNVKYQCQFCSKFFYSHQNCKIHTNKHHPDQKNVKFSLNF